MLTVEEISPDLWAFNNTPGHANSTDDDIDKALATLGVVSRLVDSGAFDEAENILREFLSEYPDNILAWGIFSTIMIEKDKKIEYYLCLREAVNLGLNTLPENELDLSAPSALQVPASFPPNIPFLQACYSLGCLHFERKEYEDAATLLGSLLLLDAEDPFAARFMLPACYIALKEYNMTLGFTQAFSQDNKEPEIIFHEALAYAHLGKLLKAKNTLLQAEKAFPKVARELRKKTHNKTKSYWTSDIEDPNSVRRAHDFWQTFKILWQTDVAKKLLASVDKEENNQSVVSMSNKNNKKKAIIKDKKRNKK